MADFTRLRKALAASRADGMAVPIWWRDDDAVASSPALDRLLRVSESLEIPVHLAVIPALAEPSLTGRIEGSDTKVLAHGWTHANHAPAGAKKAEFGHVHAHANAQLEDGRKRMEKLFAAHFLPVFVPPWNRIHPTYTAIIAEFGFKGLSTFGPRVASADAAALTIINTHVDPINWRGNRDLVDPAQLVAQTVQLLENRRTGMADATEPLGLLTHHLVHTEAIWEFAETWLGEMLDGGATPANLERALI